MNDSELSEVNDLSSRVMKDSASFYFGLLTYVGNELGIFQELRRIGPATASVIAAKGAFDQRHLEEWLGAMVAAGYVNYEPTSSRYYLTEAQAAVLADNNSPNFMSGLFKTYLPQTAIVPRLIDVMRNGGGVAQREYPDEFFTAMEEESKTRHMHNFVDVWIPSIQDLERKLQAGARVLDIGCGGGMALISAAKKYPLSKYFGCDIHDFSIESATSNSKAQNVSDRVSFFVSKEDFFGEAEYDVIMTLDVVHDAIDPGKLLEGIRKALRPDGIYMMVECQAGDKLEENISDWGKYLYSVSLLYCLTTSLAGGGAGIGALMGRTRAKQLCMDAGFSKFEEMVSSDEFSAIYKVVC